MAKYLIRCQSQEDANRLFDKAYKWYSTIHDVKKASKGSCTLVIKSTKDEYLFVSSDKRNLRGNRRPVIRGESYEKALDQHIKRIRSICDATLTSIGLKLNIVEADGAS